MTLDNKTKTKYLQIAIAISLIALAIFASQSQPNKTEPSIAEASFEDRRAIIIQNLETAKEKEARLKLEAEQNDLTKQELEIQTKKLDIEESLKVSGLEQTISSKINDISPNIEQPSTNIPQATQTVVKQTSKIAERSFKLNNGKSISGQKILDMVKGNPNGSKLWQAFYNKFGQEIADTAAVSLYYENGTMKPDSIGVCSKKFMINGDYRNCNYADMNSAGMDAGLKQINTFYQQKRIAKLSGINCKIGNSRDRKDPCTAQLINWLINVDNNVAISIDIYSEQGFCPWYGAKRSKVVKC